MGIYARENGQGMVFETEMPTPPPDGGGEENDSVGKSGKTGGDKPAGAAAKRPSLRVVK